MNIRSNGTHSITAAMKHLSKLQFVTLSLILASLLHVHGFERKPYVVYMGNAVKTMRYVERVDQHHNMLSSIIGDEEIAQKSRIHSYGRSFNAFAAHLLPHEAQKLQDIEGVVSVFPNTVRELHTTRSWDFIGMPLLIRRNLHLETNIIVGLLDTGIYINAPSFNDTGLGPPPSKWKGTCQVGANFTACNNKVIGARAYDLANTDTHAPPPSPIDMDGHGTHTSSTAAGATVAGASLYGLAQGTARGGVPSARIAMYKVCGSAGCADIDILAAFDDAIADGVDLLSVSLGSDVSGYFSDSIAIGAFHAMQNGILTACSAGNDGPFRGSAQNIAPWILTVAATGMDRRFRTNAKLGNGKTLTGISVNTFEMKKKVYPLISGALASNGDDTVFASAAFCGYGTLDEKKVRGKIVMCKSLPDAEYMAGLGVAGMIAASTQRSDTALSFEIPTTIVDTDQSLEVEKYINGSKNPQAVIIKSFTDKTDAPFVASFSSRGPNAISPTILKPDIVAPGIDILAAYTKLSSVTGDSADKRFDVYNILSGTSMACPHVAGAAAYVKTFHPQWSPTAIKSALMTTTTIVNDTEGIAEWGYGAGQLNPLKAIRPGLIYDMSEKDYIRFLCTENYHGSALSMIVGKRMDCKRLNRRGHDTLNYPTMNVQLADPNSTISAVFHRTVTNVGSHKAVYEAVVKAPEGLRVTVSPRKLEFEDRFERRHFTVKVTGPAVKKSTPWVLSASLEWIYRHYKVRSPIVVTQNM